MHCQRLILRACSSIRHSMCVNMAQLHCQSHGTGRSSSLGLNMSLCLSIENVAIAMRDCSCLHHTCMLASFTQNTDSVSHEQYLPDQQHHKALTCTWDTIDTCRAGLGCWVEPGVRWARARTYTCRLCKKPMTLACAVVTHLGTVHFKPNNMQTTSKLGQLSHSKPYLLVM